MAGPPKRWSALGLAVLLGTASCGSEHPPEAPPPKVEVIRPLARDVVDWDEYAGRLQAVKFVEVRPRVSGYLESIHFEDGAIVDEGQLLFVIDPRPYRAALSGARAALTSAKARVDLALQEQERAERLAKGHVISDEQLDQRTTTLREARAAAQSAEAAVESARLELDFTQIHAPMRGRVGARAVDVGNLISGGTAQSTLLTTIVSLDPIYCYFDADEREVLKYIRLGQTGERASGREVAHPVLLGLTDEDGFPHRGHLDFIDNRIDSGTGTMRARAVFPNPDHLLVPGLFGRVRIAGTGRYRGLVIPDLAVQTDQSQQFVYLVGTGDKVEFRAIEGGPRIGELRIVRKGIDPSERIAVSGFHRLRPGMDVEVSEVPFRVDADLFDFVDLLAPTMDSSRMSERE